MIFPPKIWFLFLCRLFYSLYFIQDLLSPSQNLEHWDELHMVILDLFKHWFMIVPNFIQTFFICVSTYSNGLLESQLVNLEFTTFPIQLFHWLQFKEILRADLMTSNMLNSWVNNRSFHIFLWLFKREHIINDDLKIDLL